MSGKMKRAFFCLLGIICTTTLFANETSRLRGTVLRCLGRSGVGDLIERTCAFATRFVSGRRQAGYAVLNEVVLNQVIVSFGSNDKNRRVLKAIQDEGDIGGALRS